MLRDVRYAFRLMGKYRGFTFVAVLTLALGVGVNTAIFSLADGILFRPLPFREPHRLALIQPFDAKTGTVYGRVDRVDVEQIAAHHGGLEGLALMERGRTYTWIGSDGAESISTTQVTANLLGVLGVGAHAGRPLTPGDERVEPRPAMLTYGAWRSRFGGDPTAVGRTIAFEERTLQIVGVLPPRFIVPLQGPLAKGDLLVPEPDDPASVGNPKAGTWWPVVRLKPGVSLETAQGRIDLLMRRSVEQFPELGANRRLRIIDLQFGLFELSRPLLWLLIGASGFVLLIAFTNLASLLMARGTARQQEVGIRAAVGASRWRIIRQLLIESQVIAAAGAAAGLLLAAWAFQLIASQLPAGYYRLVPEGLDARAMVFGVCSSLLCGALFSMVPALRLSMPNLDAALRGRRTRASAGTTRAGAVLVAAEVALGLVLLSGAGLMANSLVRARTVNLGFEPSRAVVMTLLPPHSRYPSPEQRFALNMALLASVRDIPGVSAAGAIDSVQVGGIAPPVGLGAGAPREGGLWSVTPGYFAAMQMPILEGRDFTAREGRGDLRVALVNETAAALFWPGERPVVGRVLRLEKQEPLEVIGVVKDVRYGYGLGGAPSVYRPATAAARMLSIVARASGDPSAVAAMMRAAGQRLDPRLVIMRPNTLATLLGSDIADTRFQTTLFTLFASLGLLLTAIGIYGVIAFWVGGRTRELGIRLALGAEPSALRRLVLVQAAPPVLGGLAVGFAGAFVLTRQLQGLLYEITPHDPVTLAAAVLILLAVAVGAAYVPARRGSRVDPVIALKAD
jgi:putative ABC transport system permease protein